MLDRKKENKQIHSKELSEFSLVMLNLLRYWQTRTHCCGHIVAHDVSWARKRAGHKMNIVSMLRKLGNICCGHKICVRNKCCTRGQKWKHLCRQQCVRNDVSSFARAFKADLHDATLRHATSLRRAYDMTWDHLQAHDVYRLQN